MPSQHSPNHVTWRRSSHSNGAGGECLEVARTITGRLPVRDSKRADGPVLSVPTPAWTAFLREVGRA